MQTSSPLPLSRPEPADRDGEVQHAVDTYVGSLQRTGGEQIEAHQRGSDGHGVGAALYRAPPFEVSVPALTVSRLSVNLTTTRVGASIDGARMHSFDASRYALFLTPAGVPMTYRKDVPSRHINIYFHPGRFGEGQGAQAAPPLDLSRPLLNLVVPGIRILVNQLVDELQQPAMLNADAADSLARLLLVQVARHLRRMPKASSSLDPAVVKRMRDYVTAHLGERILVADMAREAGLSVDRFSVVFKDQTGQSPHRFVMDLRLERAADLLRLSAISLAEVAAICGFASQQHLTNVMHRRLGVTPRCYRESGLTQPRR